MIPWVDPEIQYINLTDLRQQNDKQFSEKTYILLSRSSIPLSVIIPYNSYLELQGLAELPKEQKAKAHGA